MTLFLNRSRVSLLCHAFAASTLFIAASNTALASSGGGSDGGSCGVMTESGWVLKDFVRARVDVGRMSPATGDTLYPTAIAATMGFEILNGKYGTQDFHQTAAYQLASSRLQKWTDDSPGFAAAVTQAMHAVSFAVTNHNFRPIAYGCREENDYPVAIYNGSYMIALISAPTWNALPLDAQAGAILKESLRFMQFELNHDMFGGEGLTENTEMLLSELVAEMTFGQPTPGKGTLTAIFRKYGKVAYEGDLASIQIDRDYAELCATGWRHWGFQCIPTVLGADPTVASLKTMAENIKDLMRQIDDRRRMTAEKKRRNEIDKFFEASWRLHDRAGALYLKRLFDSPEVLAAVRTLQEATATLGQCAATSHGDNCSVTGSINIDILSEAIANGEAKRDRRLRAAIREIQKKFQATHLAIFRD